jgi:xanthine dehydrogenase YagR molybdenum-binding subunit
MRSHVPLCAIAAKVTGKPVKLVLEREQMFGPVGGRPSTVNKIKLGADGKLLAMQQDVVMNASVMEDFVEHSEGPTKNLYMSEANSVTAKVVEVNLGVSTFMRAPGEAPGTAVLEIAMDELAEKLKMDPLQLRLVNYAVAFIAIWRMFQRYLTYPLKSGRAMGRGSGLLRGATDAPACGVSA